MGAISDKVQLHEYYKTLFSKEYAHEKKPKRVASTDCVLLVFKDTTMCYWIILSFQFQNQCFHMKSLHELIKQWVPIEDDTLPYSIQISGLLKKYSRFIWSAKTNKPSMA